MAQVKKLQRELSFDQALVEIVRMVAETDSPAPEIADAVMDQGLDYDALIAFARDGVMKVAGERIKRARRVLSHEETDPVVETVIDGDGEHQVRRVPNIKKDHRAETFRGLAKKYVAATSGRRIPIAEFGLEDLEALRDKSIAERDGYDLKVNAAEVSLAALRKYRVSTIQDLSERVQKKLDAVWLQVRG